MMRQSGLVCLWQNKSGFATGFSTAPQLICHPCRSQKIVEKANKHDQSAYEMLTHERWWLIDSFHSTIQYKTASKNRRGWGWGANLAWRCSRQSKLSRRLCDQLLLQISTKETDRPKPLFYRKLLFWTICSHLLPAASLKIAWPSFLNCFKDGGETCCSVVGANPKFCRKATAPVV